jgi:hypothetical protein
MEQTVAIRGCMSSGGGAPERVQENARIHFSENKILRPRNPYVNSGKTVSGAAIV